MALHMDRALISDAGVSADEFRELPGGSALDVSLHDRELHEEVLLTTNLVIAATESQGRLSQEEVDAILGLPRMGQMSRWNCSSRPITR